MRISDWSSDVCSSDLARLVLSADMWNAIGGAPDLRLIVRRRGGGRRRCGDEQNDKGQPGGLFGIIDHRASLSTMVRRVGAPSLPASHPPGRAYDRRSEEHTSELQSLMRLSYAV